MQEAKNLVYDRPNILKGMSSTRFNRRSDHGDTPTHPALGPTSPLINSLTVWQTNKVRKHRDGEKKDRD